MDNKTIFGINMIDDDDGRNEEIKQAVLAGTHGQFSISTFREFRSSWAQRYGKAKRRHYITNMAVDSVTGEFSSGTIVRPYTRDEQKQIAEQKQKDEEERIKKAQLDAGTHVEDWTPNGLVIRVATDENRRVLAAKKAEREAKEQEAFNRIIDLGYDSLEEYNNECNYWNDMAEDEETERCLAARC